MGLEIIILIVVMIMTSSREQTLVEDRLNQYLGEQENTQAEREAQRTAITDWVEAPLIKYETYEWYGK